VQCHKPNGLGQDGLAPPLVNSEWVLGPDQRLLRIILQGLHGPVTVNGRAFNMDMPALRALSDTDIADVATYVRGEWEHDAASVDPHAVQKIREQESTRSLPWTERELLNLQEQKD
jgi:mono/diheme cytochrome c family protein